MSDDEGLGARGQSFEGNAQVSVFSHNFVWFRKVYLSLSHDRFYIKETLDHHLHLVFGYHELLKFVDFFRKQCIRNLTVITFSLCAKIPPIKYHVNCLRYINWYDPWKNAQKSIWIPTQRHADHINFSFDTKIYASLQDSQNNSFDCLDTADASSPEAQNERTVSKWKMIFIIHFCTSWLKFCEFHSHSIPVI